MEKLSSEELKTKMDVLNNTVITLKIASSDLNCEKTRRALQAQIDTYNETIRQILYELNNRTKSNLP